MKAKKGEEAFDQYFTEVYGDRYPAIKSALYKDDEKVARPNLFCTDWTMEQNPVPGLLEKHLQLPDCYSIDDNFDLSELTTSLQPFYRMDPASIIAARALNCEPGEMVLDMCAAPGGKSLVLAEDIFLSETELRTDGLLVVNEMSARRRHRLMSVIKRHLPLEVRQRVKVRGVDGGRIGLEKKDLFDRVLLDAPCSGERGVVQKSSELAEWKEKRSKNFGIRQYALLSSAFMALKPGGSLVYSTCSISPYENDAVIAKLRKRQGEAAFSVESVALPESIPVDKTEFGYQFLPDRDGWGPIYFCRIEKS